MEQISLTKLNREGILIACVKKKCVRVCGIAYALFVPAG